MPNWNNNAVTISHEDPAQIARVVKAYNESRLFNEFYPVPEELRDPASTTYGGENKEEQDQLRESLLAKYGYESWYDWCISNWGCKWDANIDDGIEPMVSPGGLEVSLSFDTAWAPPIGWYDRMTEDGFSIDACYYEPGMSFCGRWTSDSGDDYYNIEGDSKWVRENIPAYIDEMFDISGNMEMWEEESEEE